MKNIDTDIMKSANVIDELKAFKSIIDFQKFKTLKLKQKYPEDLFKKLHSEE